MAVYFNSEINRRSANEDSFCDLKLRINHEAAVHVMAVADGMGGLTGGKVYSETAVQIFNEKLLKLIMGNDFKGSSLFEQTELLKNFCKRVFQEINQELYTRGLDAGVKGGTTLTTVIRFWHNYIIANCGDSPVYYMKDGKLNLIADIQNAAWQMLIQGKTSLGSLLYCQNKTILLQYLGRREKVKPFVKVLPEEETDCLLLGTDGAFGNLGKDRLAGIIRDNPDGTELLDQLFEAARGDGEEDNQTAIFYRRERPEQPSGPIQREWKAGTGSYHGKTGEGQVVMAEGKTGEGQLVMADREDASADFIYEASDRTTILMDQDVTSVYGGLGHEKGYVKLDKNISYESFDENALYEGRDGSINNVMNESKNDAMNGSFKDLNGKKASLKNKIHLWNPFARR